MTPFKTRRQAQSLMGISVCVCLMCLASIVIAEVFMPNNLAGQTAVVTFYRWFGLGILLWTMIGWWAYSQMPGTETNAQRSEVS